MNESFERKQDSVYSKRLKAGKRRTYFFDVRTTRASDYFLTITESRKRMTDDGYDRHKIFLYKEDFHKFMRGLNEAVDFVKTELMPDFNFDAYNHDESDDVEGADNVTATNKPIVTTDLLKTTAFDGQSEINGYPMEKVSDLPQPKIDSINSEENNVLTKDKPEPGTSRSEEVDRW